MADERPSKKRKLSHDEENSKVDASSPASDSPEIMVDPDDTDYVTGAGPAADSKADGETEAMSKNQLKKLRKRQEWEAGRDYRKAKRKQKAKEKKERKRATWEEVRANGEQPMQPTSRRPRNPVRLPITFIIDCGFDDLMVEKEMISLGSQVTRSYSDNVRSQYQAHLVVSSWSGKLKERFDTVLNGHYKNWKDMRFMEEGFVEVAEKAKEWMAEPKENRMAGVFAKFASQKSQQEPELALGETKSTSAEPYMATSTHSHPPPTAPSSEPPAIAPSTQPESAQKSPLPVPSNFSSDPSPTTTAPQGEIIYLSSDSPYTLTELQPYSTYIIGGLVDKNRHKGICQKIATEKGIRTAKLPISEFMEMQSRSVLATNHVNEIMLRWLECGDWGKAFMQVIPKRKGGKLRGQGNGGGDGAEQGEGEGLDEDDEAGEEEEVGVVDGEGLEGKDDETEQVKQAGEGA